MVAIFDFDLPSGGGCRVLIGVARLLATAITVHLPFYCLRTVRRPATEPALQRKNWQAPGQTAVTTTLL